MKLCGRLEFVLGILIASLIELPAIAGQLNLQIHDGRVTLDAKDVTVEQILAEWARVGQTRIINNGDRVPGDPVTLQLVSVPERIALDAVLGLASGYVAVARRPENPGLSSFDRILVLPTSNVSKLPVPGPGATAPPAAGQPFLSLRDLVLPEELRDLILPEPVEEDGAQTLPPPFDIPGLIPPGLPRTGGGTNSSGVASPPGSVRPAATNPFGIPGGPFRVPGIIPPAPSSPAQQAPDSSGDPK